MCWCLPACTIRACTELWLWVVRCDQDADIRLPWGCVLFFIILLYGIFIGGGGGGMFTHLRSIFSPFSLPPPTPSRAQSSTPFTTHGARPQHAAAVFHSLLPLLHTAPHASIYRYLLFTVYLLFLGFCCLFYHTQPRMCLFTVLRAGPPPTCRWSTPWPRK